MANSNTPFGLRLFDGTAIQRLRFRVTQGYTTSLFHNDPVVTVAAGTVERPAVTGKINGVITGFERYSGTAWAVLDVPPQPYYLQPDSLYSWKVIAECHPAARFLCQDDGDTTPITTAEIGMNIDMIFTHAGNATTGISGMELDSSSFVVTAGRPLKIIELADWMEPDGTKTTGAANGKWLVGIENHALAEQIAGI